VLARDAVHMADCEGEEAAAGAGQRGADEEVPDTECELALRVEEGQVDGHAGEQAAFHGAQEEPAYHQPGEVLHDARQSGDDAPGHRDEGDPARGGELLEDQVGWQFAEDVGDEEDGDGDLELVAVEAEVGFQGVEPGIADVDSGDVLGGKMSRLLGNGF
jgi:hypothetical protein